MSNKNNINAQQMEIITLETLVREDHVYRTYAELIDFEKLFEPIKAEIEKKGRIPRLWHRAIIQVLTPTNNGRHKR